MSTTTVAPRWLISLGALQVRHRRPLHRNTFAWTSVRAAHQKRLGSLYRSGTTTNWIKVKCFIESDLELLGVQRETGKPTMALLGEPGTRRYVGSAFVVFARPASEEFKAMVDANPGSPPPDLKRKSKELVQWLRPGIVGRVRHLRGEDKLRHATLVSVAQSGFYDI